MEWEESIFLTSGNTTKLQSSRQYGTGTKTEIMEQNRKYRDKSKHLQTPYLDKGGKSIQWRKDKCCAMKTGHLHV